VAAQQPSLLIALQLLIAALELAAQGCHSPPLPLWSAPLQVQSEALLQLLLPVLPTLEPVQAPLQPQPRHLRLPQEGQDVLGGRCERAAMVAAWVLRHQNY